MSRLATTAVAATALAWLGAIVAAQQTAHVHHAPAQARMLASPLDLDDLDAVCADLAERYNAAYKELKESGDVDLSQYEYAYDISK